MAYYNCLLFDVDDTLLDFGAAERAALGEMLEHFQLPADEETIARYGERLGIPTPYNSVLADLISCIQDNYSNQYGMENG